MTQPPTPTADDPSELEALSVLDNYRTWIVDAFAPFLKGHGVEYGAGIGSISEALLAHVSSLDLVEPHAASASKLRQRFADRANVHVLEASIESSAAACLPETYDAIVMVNVLEHIADDRAALRELWRLLKPGGALCIFVPAHPVLYSDYDRLVGHHRRYERAPLNALVSGAGFSVVESRYFDVLGTVPWLITMKFMGTTRIAPTLACLYDRLVVPLGRRIEAFAPPPFGKNVLLVARKMAAQ